MSWKKKGFRSNLFDTDLRCESRAPALRDEDFRSWGPDSGCSKGEREPLMYNFPEKVVERPCFRGVKRMESYKAPSMMTTLETIAEDQPDFLNFQRSRSVPVLSRQSCTRYRTLDSGSICKSSEIYGVHNTFGKGSRKPLRDDSWKALVRDLLKGFKLREVCRRFFARLRPRS